MRVQSLKRNHRAYRIYKASSLQSCYIIIMFEYCETVNTITIETNRWEMINFYSFFFFLPHHKYNENKLIEKIDLTMARRPKFN